MESEVPLLQQVEGQKSEFAEALSALKSDSAATIKDVEDLRVRFTGKKSPLQTLIGGLKSLDSKDRAAAGKALNLLKREFDQGLKEVREQVEARQQAAQLSGEWVDVTLDLDSRSRGGLHPLSVIQYQVEDVFTSMGFQILDGPHIETEYFNFEALNTPADHPARDLQDTFYFEDGNVLRTHTSSIQIRGMKRLEPPFKIIGPGKVFRCEKVDASHEATFHQLEGMMVDRDIKVAHLSYFLKELLSEVYRREIEIRLRPGFFPFVEPGFELDIACLLCGGKGCKVCKNLGWVELLGCGMVHPNVLRHGNIDPDEWSGFAFGMGLDRLVMSRYGIDDIRLIHSADLRFFRQFV
jgi:phenylalanyl-tRNA synthetase alpha chain